MPLTDKGRKILAAMQQHYGEQKGKSVFYASKNAGRIGNVDSHDSQAPDMQKIQDRLMGKLVQAPPSFDSVYQRMLRRQAGDEDPMMPDGEPGTGDSPGTSRLTSGVGPVSWHDRRRLVLDSMRGALRGGMPVRDALQQASRDFGVQGMRKGVRRAVATPATPPQGRPQPQVRAQAAARPPAQAQANPATTQHALAAKSHTAAAKSHTAAAEAAHPAGAHPAGAPHAAHAQEHGSGIPNLREVPGKRTIEFFKQASGAGDAGASATPPQANRYPGGLDAAKASAAIRARRSRRSS